jgi:hypothetical protein
MLVISWSLCFLHPIDTPPNSFPSLNKSSVYIQDITSLNLLCI